MQRVTKINKTEIDKLLLNKKVTKEDIAAHFLIQESIDGNKVIFSNPQRQNFISNEKSPSPGNLNNPIALDFQRATVYWDTSNNSKDE